MGIVMNRAVDFNRQTRGMAVKIEDVGADRVLTTEFKPL